MAAPLSAETAGLPKRFGLANSIKVTLIKPTWSLERVLDFGKIILFSSPPDR
jgi:hypothetical protein